MTSEYFAPTRVIFGEGAVEHLAEALKNENAERVLVLYGGKSAVNSGLIGRIEKTLADGGFYYRLIGGVKPNPRIELARTAVDKVLAEDLDFILAVGGGSVIDTAKAVGYGSAHKCDPWLFYNGEKKPERSLGVGVVLTIAAAGSEMSDSSVLTNEELGLKRGCNSNVCRCRFALMDPTLTYTLPSFQTACGSVDIQMHTIERYFHPGKGLPLTDELAFALIRNVRENGLKAMKEPENYDARACLMWASSISHNNLMQVGNPCRGDWACHPMEHELSGMFDIAHGAGLAIVFPAWLRYVLGTDDARIAKLGRNVFGLTGTDDRSVALSTIDSFVSFYKELGLATTLHDAGIELTEDMVTELTDKALCYGAKKSLGAFRPLYREDIAEIYRMCR